MKKVKEIRLDNLHLLIKYHGSQKALAENADMDAGHISQLNKGRRGIGEDLARKLEQKLKLSQGWMDCPHNDMLAPSSGQIAEERSRYGDVEPAAVPVESVPLISWVSAREFVDISRKVEEGYIEDWLPGPVKRGGGKTIALRVKGDSMTSPYGKTFPDGSIIYVDTQQLNPPSGAYVIAQIEGEKEITFKQYINEPGATFLKSLNPSYPVITRPFEILGTVIGKWEDV